MASVEKMNTLKASGCAVFLLFWLCEICPLIKPERNVPQFPRFRKWSIEKLSFEMGQRDISTFSTKPGLFLGRLCPLAIEMEYMDGEIPPVVPVGQPVEFEDEPEEHVDSKLRGLDDGDGGGSEDVHLTGMATEPVRHIADQFGRGVAVQDFPSATENSSEVSNIAGGAMGIGEQPNVQLGAEVYEQQLHTWAQLLESACNAGDEFESEMLNCFPPGEVVENAVVYDQRGEGQSSPGDKLDVELHQLQGLQMRKNMAESLECIKALEQRLVEKDEVLAELLRIHENEKTRITQLNECRVSEIDLARRKATAEMFVEADARHEIGKQLQLEIENKVKQEETYKEMESKYKEEKDGKVKYMRQYEAALERVKDLQCLVKELNDKIDSQNIELARRQTVLDSLDLSDDDGVSTPKVPKQVAAGVIPYVFNSDSEVGNVGLGIGPLVPYSSSGTTRTPAGPKSALRNGGGVSTPIRPANLFPGNSPSSVPSGEMTSKSKHVTFLNTTPVALKAKTGPTLSTYAHVYMTPISKSSNSSAYGLGTGEVVMNSVSPITDIIKKTRSLDLIAEKAVATVDDDKESGEPGSEEAEVVPVIRPFLHRPECPGVRIVGKTIVKWLVKKFEERLPGETILKVNTSTLRAEINLEDFERMVNHDRYTDSIIDAWGMVHVTRSCGPRLANETRGSVMEKPFLFKSAIWLYVARFSKDPKYSRAAVRFIDQKIPDAVKYEEWILPVNTSGSLCPLKHKGDHWTLLHYSKEYNLWTFYNSIGAPLAEDTHFKAVTMLIDYIRNCVVSYCERTGTRVPMYVSKPGIVRSSRMPLQAMGSLDCGPLVCNAVESLVWGKKLTPVMWTVEMGGEYRAHMMRVFYGVIRSSGLP